MALTNHILVWLLKRYLLLYFYIHSQLCSIFFHQLYMLKPHGFQKLIYLHIFTELFHKGFSSIIGRNGRWFLHGHGRLKRNPHGTFL